MKFLFAAALLLVGTATITVHLASAQTTTTIAPPVAVTVSCKNTDACYPWSGSGPGCVRGGRMNLRFATSAIEENGRNVTGIQAPVTDVTYAFCPKVDELQAFNLTNFTQEGAVFFGASSATFGSDLATEKWRFSEKTKTTYLSAIGFGNQTLRIVPPLGSGGNVLVVDARPTNGCKAATGEVGVVDFLILNISLNNGVFRYLAGHPQPPGNGFSATCDADDVCSVNADLKCFGDFKGRKNCGSCYPASKAADVARLTMQIWVSYYGTDGNGRLLRSGASNPMNFRKYSLGGVYNDVMTSVQNIEINKLPAEDGLNPTGGFLHSMKKWFSTA